MADSHSIFLNFPFSDKRRYRMIVRGILAEADQRRNVKINLSSFFILEHLRSEMEHGFDGMITEGGYPDGPPGLLGSMPMVGVRQPPDTGGLPRVLIDPASVAERAFDHFQRQGVRHFGFFHNQDPIDPEGRIRSDAFSDLLRRKKLTPHAFPNGPRSAKKWSLRAQVADLADWLRDLPKPCGILVGDDEHAQRLLMAGAEADVAVPRDAAVLSYGNDSLFCDALHPSLSSIEPRYEDVGREALRRLVDEIEGNPRRDQISWLSCGPVVRRESTDRRYADFPFVQRAVRMFEEDMAEIGSARQLADTLGISHNGLNNMFRNATGSSTWAYFRSRRLDHAKHLLETTDLSLADICAETGIATISKLSNDIKTTFGKTPRQIRTRDGDG